MLHFPLTALATGVLAALLAGPLASLPGASAAPGVLVAQATRLGFPLTVEAVGTAVANESIDVRVKVSETITAIHFDEGQRVEAGAVLVELENRAALAAVAAARADLVQAEGRHRRAQQLLKTQAVSVSEIESVAAARDASRAALAAAEARLSDSVLRAPFGGRVGLRRVSVGTLVGPGTLITTLDDTETIKLDFDVPETALSRVGVGLPVRARSAAWPDRNFSGNVISVDTRVDPVSRAVTIRAAIPNPDGELRPGMFLTVEVVRADVTALMVPEQSIVPEQSQQFVLVVDKDGTVEKRAVRTGRRRPGQVEIVEGLAEGEVVVAEGTQKARPGAEVAFVGRIEVGQP